MSDEQLKILHDHYKETFARIRDTEITRDRLFLWVIGLFALLSLEIGYPAATGGAFGKLTIAGGELNLQALPFAALLDATWVLTFAISLRYCQTTTLVDRQYPYLHKLETAISPALGGGDLYQREGKNYLKRFPLSLNVTWIAYVLIFPIIVIFATFSLIRWETTHLSYPWYHTCFDAFMACSLVCCFILYRMYPHPTS